MKKPFFRKRASGVTRIVRDSYGKKGDWYSLCKDVKERDGHKCVFCGKPENAKANTYHDVHHIIPLSKGGTTSKANLATTCDDCHAKRPGHSHMKVSKGPIAVTRHTTLGTGVSGMSNGLTANKFSSWRK